MDEERFEPLPGEVIRRVREAGVGLSLIPVEPGGGGGGVWAWSPNEAPHAPEWVASVRHVLGGHCDKRGTARGKAPGSAVCRALEELVRKFAEAEAEAVGEEARARLPERRASASAKAAELRSVAAGLTELSRSISAAIRQRSPGAAARPAETGTLLRSAERPGEEPRVSGDAVGEAAGR